MKSSSGASGKLDADGAAALARWDEVCADPVGRASAWISGSDPPTFMPFDALLLVSGTDAIVDHLAQRQRRHGPAKMEARRVASWREDGCILLVAEALLRQNFPGGAETRKMMVVIAATTGGTVQLIHVTEAVPAVLPLVIESYRRPRQSPARP